MSIEPVNGHLLIEPLKHETFMASQRKTYEEVGIVISIPAPHYSGLDKYDTTGASVGDKVFFDSWLAAKYPKNDKEFYWLVKWSDVRAIEKTDAVS